MSIVIGDVRFVHVIDIAMSDLLAASSGGTVSVSLAITGREISARHKETADSHKGLNLLNFIHLMHKRGKDGKITERFLFIQPAASSALI